MIAVYGKEIDGVIELCVRDENTALCCNLRAMGAQRRASGGHRRVPARLGQLQHFTLGSGALDIGGGPYKVPSTLTKTGQTGFTASSWLFLKASAPSSGDDLAAAT